MLYDALFQFLESPLLSLFGCVIFGAIALSGKLNLLLARFLLLIAWVFGLLSTFRTLSRYHSWEYGTMSAISLIVVGLFYWLSKPKSEQYKLEIQTIELGDLIVGQPFTATVYFRNVSGAVIAIKNLAYTETRPFPTSPLEEKENELSLWGHIEKNIGALGRDAEVPIMGNGEFNQTLETYPVSLAEIRDVYHGSHAFYFAMKTVDRATGRRLIELCFFVGAKGIISYCSSHNYP